MPNTGNSTFCKATEFLFWFNLKRHTISNSNLSARLTVGGATSTPNTNRGVLQISANAENPPTLRSPTPSNDRSFLLNSSEERPANKNHENDRTISAVVDGESIHQIVMSSPDLPVEPLLNALLFFGSTSTQPSNPQWQGFHEQSIRNDGCFKAKPGVDFEILFAWLATSPVGVLSLKIDRHQIGDDGAVAFAKVLKVNNQLLAADLSHCGINAQGAAALADALKINTSLRTLNLAFNKIGFEGAILLASALKINPALTSLNLRLNTIGDKGARAFADTLTAKSTLCILNLTCNGISNEGAIMLANALPWNISLRELNLSLNAIDDAGAIAFAGGLKRNQFLRSLVLNYNLISDVGAEALAGVLEVNSTLGVLSLRSNKITSQTQLNRIYLELAKTIQLSQAIKGAKVAIALYGPVDVPLLPADVTDIVIDQMAQLGLKDEIIKLSHSVNYPAQIL